MIGDQQGLDYQYGGQWFDDMGALALTFESSNRSPALGIQLANSQMPRLQTNDMANAMYKSNIDPYEGAQPQG